MAEQEENALTTDENLAKDTQPVEQKKPDEERVDTVTPGNDNGAPGKPAEEPETDSSNKDSGPSGENL